MPRFSRSAIQAKGIVVCDHNSQAKSTFLGSPQQFSLCDGDGSPNPKPEIRNPKEIRDPKADSASSPFNAEAQ
ncbi:MAG: hypothetical protein NT167_10815, partial [Verrucomicrobia bacterium]|nr:hypothetical protein [Verrucomicrobiota bacterium]